MALTNLILTVAGVSAVILLMRSDVKQSASIFKRNVRQIRHWLEQESSPAAQCPGTYNAWANRVNAKDEKRIEIE
ncbi:hypothetical protein RHMOL_Rhmol10G0006300 [Rhododendron molle]|uniref:Uncharacterized protein n=1 Tax=Rhododendron molle TaxID=49168 RepID=A0ACC0LYL3_RHOML|nr:hypothetical protein RHMOL_Rhmol10G0006300 [Rhododendron molle]